MVGLPEAEAGLPVAIQMIETQAGQRRQEMRVAQRQRLLSDHEGVLCGGRPGKLRLPRMAAAQQVAENRLGIAGQHAFSVESECRVGQEYPVLTAPGKSECPTSAVIERVQGDLVTAHGKPAGLFQLPIVESDARKCFTQLRQHATFQPGNEMLGASLARAP